MKTEFLLGEELSILQKDPVCISVIVPTHRLSHERRVDHLEVERALNTARGIVANQSSEGEAGPLLQKLDELYNQIDFNRNAEGIGLFVSEHTKEVVSFHFPVYEKVVVSNTFEIREWLYHLYYTSPYYVLLLSETDARLFSGRLNTLEEIHDQRFPLKYDALGGPSLRNLFASFPNTTFTKEPGKEKTQLKDTGYLLFLEHVAQTLNSYLESEIPVIAVGDRYVVSAFKAKAREGLIAGEIYVNTVYTPLTELAEASWDALRFYLNRQKQQLLPEFEEKLSEGLGVYGLLQCWKAAKEGRALTLMVEKDYSVPGYLAANNELQLYLHPPAGTHNILPDAVNTLIEEVLARGGHVVLQENGALFNYLRVGIITRY